MAETNGVSYRANGVLAMRHAPGSPPNALPLPAQVIDFAQVETLNAPWLLASELPEFPGASNFVARQSFDAATNALWEAVGEGGGSSPAPDLPQCILRESHAPIATTNSSWMLKALFSPPMLPYVKSMEIGRRI